MGFVVARIALHRNARSRGYKLLREGTDPRSLLRGVCVCVLFLRCSLNRGPCPPFIASKERAQVTFVVKRWKWERMKEKNKKKVASGVGVFLLIRWEQFSL
jgi:hypothetical protein